MCTLLTGGNLMWTGLLASVLFLVLIAVERYHAVLHPLNHQSGFVVTKLKSIVTVLWIYAFVWQIPAFAFFRSIIILITIIIFIIVIMAIITFIIAVRPFELSLCMPSINLHVRFSLAV